MAGTAILAGTGALVGGFIGSALLFLLQAGAPGGITLSVDIPFATVVGGSFGAAVGVVIGGLIGYAAATILLRLVSPRRSGSP